MSIYDTKINQLLHFRCGKNAQDNWDIVESSKSNDVWFHLEHVSSCHVVLTLPEGIHYSDLAKQTLIHCAVECKRRTKSNNTSTSVIFSEIAYIVKGDSVGSVIVNRLNKKNKIKI
jgi:predicted ribosome quality control (RQC) complex YloA/Tae2 family protein